MHIMKRWWNNVYRNNKAMVWAAIISIVLSVGILFKVKDEVTRFTLIMPIFAGFILFSILVTPDEELEDKSEEEQNKNTPKKKKKS